MQTVKQLVRTLVKGEEGGEVLEYAIVAGLIVVGSIVLIGTLGTTVSGIWRDTNTNITTEMSKAGGTGG